MDPEQKLEAPAAELGAMDWIMGDVDAPEDDNPEGRMGSVFDRQDEDEHEVQP